MNRYIIRRYIENFLAGNGCTVQPARVTAVISRGLVRVVYYRMIWIERQFRVREISTLLAKKSTKIL